jgi:hypothetical protein
LKIKINPTILAIVMLQMRVYNLTCQFTEKTQENNPTIRNVYMNVGPPLWSSGQSPGFDFRALQKKVVGLERGPLSLVSTTEELLDRKVAAPV